MSQASRALAFAVVTAITLWVVLNWWPDLGTAPRIYVGAIALAVGAAIAYAASLRYSAASGAVTGLALGAASLAIVGLVANQVIGAGSAPTTLAQGIGLIVVLVAAGLFVFMGTTPKISWSKLPVITTFAAIAIVLAYAATIVYMLNSAGLTATTETIWARYLVIFTAVQGVGLAAVGALLGTQVKQAEVNKAQSDTKDVIAAAKTLKNAPPSGATPPAIEISRAEAVLNRLDSQYN